MSWTDRLAEETLAERTADLVREGHLDGERAVFVHDLDRMKERVAALQEAFPRGALHAIAVKANPVLEILRVLVEAGAGLECASAGEVQLSLAAGCPPEKVVFDSPAKTREELAFALREGIHVNADSLAELERIASLVEGTAPPGHIGIRVNPQVGEGSIAMTSVAAPMSKFGVPIRERRAELVEAFSRYPWLDGLHVHVGSQGCDLDQLVSAVKQVVELRDEAASRRDDGITQLDIGGGLPAKYRESDRPPELVDYVGRLRDAVPSAFGSDTRLLTEFGRAVHASSGWAVSRVEYVRKEGRQMAVIHLGADAFMRPVYAPDDWSHDFVVLTADGALKEGPRETTMIAGPLCFGGDFLARNRPLPRIEPGDLVVVRDAGAYTLATWSRHCSRGLPKVIGWGAEGSRILKRPEAPKDVVDFWAR